MIEGFLLPSLSASDAMNTLRAQQGEASNAEGKDLFDYFDPLLSPHAYPNGIDAGATSTNDTEESTSDSSPSQASSPLGFTSAASQSAEPQNRQGEDLFDYFDPLLSPHAYPNGINAGAAATSTSNKETPSPTPLQVVNDDDNARKKKVGVLLMDHGSRNPASNLRLEKMAELYQLTTNMDSTNGHQDIVVEAAHMEIASPSIAEGLQKLLDQNVDEIICHPYFLSPGRHVTEDIPELLQQAKDSLQIQIPMVTTQPIGANTQLMIGAIHALVQEHSNVLQTNQNQQQ